jgi:large subunit ribosomal protein L35
MPKLKTNKALSKRVKVTKNGKVVRPHAGKSHLNSGMSPKRRRQLRRKGLVAAAYAKRMLRALGKDTGGKSVVQTECTECQK